MNCEKENTSFTCLPSSLLPPSHSPLLHSPSPSPPPSLSLSLSSPSLSQIRSRPGIYVHYLIPGSKAEECGQVHPGDRILEANGRDLRHATVDEAAMFMSVGKTSEVYPPLSSSSIVSFPPSFITTFYTPYAPPAASSWFPEAVDRPLPQIPNFLRVKSLQPLLCPLPGTHV